jgi:23S rRNA (pseudouridine1915-N3)-methyltransferase
MALSVIAVGTRMPGWVEAGVEEYARRMRNELGFSIVEIAMAKRGKNVNVGQCMQREGEAMLAKVSGSDYVVALDVKGRALDTPGLANRLQHIQEQGRRLVLLVGGPDGLDPSCLQRADETWSLSPLTMPHPLVRILLAEQLYRAHSLNKGHPYHRE